MKNLKVTCHAIQRYAQRVLNLEYFIVPSSSQGRVIQIVLKRAFETYQRMGKAKGHYKVNDNIYVYIENDTIITTILKDRDTDMFVSDKMLKEYSQESKNNVQYKSNRISRINHKTKRERVEANYASPEAKRISELLNQVKKTA